MPNCPILHGGRTLLCTATTLFIVGVGSAEAQHSFSTTIYETATAGQTGDAYAERGVSGAGITGLKIEEKRDTPCRVQVFSSSTPTNWYPDACASGTRGDIEIQFGTDTFLYKLQTCTNDRANVERRRFIKGIRGWGRRVIAPGQLRNEGAVVADEQPNCRNNWGQNGVAECPAGQVASEVVIHYRYHDPTDKAVVGLSLRCRTVQWADDSSNDQASGDGVTPRAVGDRQNTGATPAANLPPNSGGASGKPIDVKKPGKPTELNQPSRPTGSGGNTTRPRPTGGVSNGAGGVSNPTGGSGATSGGTLVRPPSESGGQSGGTSGSTQPGGATPDGTLSWTSPTNWIGPTGGQGNEHHRWVGDPGYALRYMGFKEHGDDPVHVEVTLQELCADVECSGRDSYVFETGGWSGNVISNKDLWAGELHYAVALKACTSRSGKLKGMRMWGARIRTDGTFDLPADPAEFRRTNCRDWGEKIQCGTNQVIVGLWLHEETGDGFVGVSIKCGRVAMD